MSDTKVLRKPDYLDQLLTDPHGYPCPGNSENDQETQEKLPLCQRLSMMVTALSQESPTYNFHYQLNGGTKATISFIAKKADGHGLNSPVVKPVEAATFDDKTKEFVVADDSNWSSTNTHLKEKIIAAFVKHVI